MKMTSLTVIPRDCEVSSLRYNVGGKPRNLDSFHNTRQGKRKHILMVDTDAKSILID